jgi:hypothetical protein
MGKYANGHHGNLSAWLKIPDVTAEVSEVTRYGIMDLNEYY